MRSLTITGKPNACVTKVIWLTPISLDKDYQQGGSVLPIKFLLRQCCGCNGGRDPDHNGDLHSDDHHGHGDDNHDGRDDDDDRHGCGCDDDHSGNSGGDDDHRKSGDDDERSRDYSGKNVFCHHRQSDGKSVNAAGCGHDCDHDEDRNGCTNLRDTTVKISIYEVRSTVPAMIYPYGVGSPNPPDYAINGNYQYHLNFPTARGQHTYHIDVYRFPAGTTTPVLVGSKEFSTK